MKTGVCLCVCLARKRRSEVEGGLGQERGSQPKWAGIICIKYLYFLHSYMFSFYIETEVSAAPP